MQCQRRYFAIPITSLNAGGGSGEQRGPRMRGSARSPLFAVEDVSRGRGAGYGVGGGGRAHDLARIFAAAIGELQSGLRGCVGPPGPHLW